MKRAYSVRDILNTKFDTLEFEGQWFDAVGKPEPTGSWMIWGSPKNGKTSFAMQLAKYLTKFGRVAYNSVEEGNSLTIRQAIERVNMDEVAGRFKLLDKESIDELIERLDRQRSPDYIFFDSVQFADLKFSEYKKLKHRYPKKLFIFVSHQTGNNPDGKTAIRIFRDVNVSFYIDGFKAIPTGRYGGGKEIIVNEQKANEHWGSRLVI